MTLPGTDLPARGSKPWYSTFVAAWDNLRNFVKTHEDLIGSGRLSQQAIADAAKAPVERSIINIDGTSHPGMLVDAGATLNALFAAYPGREFRIGRGRYPALNGVIQPGGTKVTGDNACIERRFAHSGANPGAVLWTAVEEFGPQKVPTDVAFTKGPVFGAMGGYTRLAFPDANHGFAPKDYVKIIADDAIIGGRRQTTTEFPRTGDYLRVLRLEGNDVILAGYPQEYNVGSFTTNVRAAKLSSETAVLEGMQFDVSDEIYASMDTDAPMGGSAAVRISGMLRPRVDRVVVHRSAGPGIQIQACVDAVVDMPHIGEAMTYESKAIFGYGIHNIASKNTQVNGGTVNICRHGFDDKSANVAANSDKTKDYGRSMYARVRGLTVIAPLYGAVSTHQESYGNIFDGCHVNGNPDVGAYSMRGMAHKLIGCSARNADVFATVQTETAYATGESRGLEVIDCTAEDCTFAFRADIHTGRVHNDKGKQDTERNLTVRGFTGRRLRGLGVIENAKAMISDLDITFADNPWPDLLLGLNSEIVLAGTQWLDGRNVAVGAVDGAGNAITTQSIVRMGVQVDSVANGTTASVTPRNRLTQTGQMHFLPSAYWAPRFQGGCIKPDANTDLNFPANTSLNLYRYMSGGVLPSTPTYRKQFTFGWRYVADDDDITNFGSTTTFAASGVIEALNSQIEDTSALRNLMASPESDLLLVASIQDGVSRTLAIPPRARRRGVTFEVFAVVGSSSAATVKVRHGSAFGVLLTGGADIDLTNGQRLILRAYGSTFRQVGPVLT